MPAPQLSVIVPCLNEREAVLDTLRQIRKCLAGRDYEILAVDDGSTDGTLELLEEEARRHREIHVLTHRRTHGYGAALKSGLRSARGELVAITDADGTYPIGQLPKLVEACAEQDMVVGARTGTNVHYPWIRRIPKILLKHWAQWLTRRSIPDINSGLRVFRRSVAERFLPLLPDGFSFTLTITLCMLRNDYRVDFLPIDYAPRIGRSKIRPIADTATFFSLVLRTGMYFAPLRALAPLVALLTMIFLGSLAYDVWVLQNLTDKTVLLFLFAMNTSLLALLGDMIDKRSR